MTNKYKDFLKLNFYQIYPRSFMDLNNDGTGDLLGIISKIPYLKDLGINAVWISPFYKSPNVDSGYDIDDYCDIDSKYGTLDDFKELIKKMHEANIKVIIDLVVNHCSTNHYWFKEAIKSVDNPYHDYFYFYDKPLNDWKSVFGGSAWEYVESLNQYYLHSFAVEQADLNWNNKNLREEVKKIVDFWVDFGVDGFRCDVLDRISKDFDNNIQQGGPHLHEYINEIFGRSNTAHLYTIGECWGTNEKSLIDLTASSRGELTASFLSGNVKHHNRRFNLIENINYSEIHDYFCKYETLCEENDLIFAPFFENHDQARSVSRLLKDKSKRYEFSTFIATLLYTIKGTPFILQGQEFGTPDPFYYDIKDFDDVETINFYNSHKDSMNHNELIELINRDSRDSGRRPMMWNGSINGGFNEGCTPWLSIHNEYQKYNLENDLKMDKSIFKYYKKLLSLRNSSDTLLYGKFIDYTNSSKDYFIYERKLNNESYLIILNYDKMIKFNKPNDYEVVTSNYNDIDDTYLRPFESIIMKKIDR